MFSSGDKTSVDNTPMLQFLLNRACTLLRPPLPLKLPLQPTGRGGQEAGRGHSWETCTHLSEQGLAGILAASWDQPTTLVYKVSSKSELKLLLNSDLKSCDRVKIRSE